MLNKITTLGPPPTITFSKSGKPLKEVDPNIIVCWGKFNPKTLSWIKDFKLKVWQCRSWSFEPEGCYLGHELVNSGNSAVKAVTVYSAKTELNYYNWDINHTGGSIKLQVRAAKESPLATIQAKLVTPLAIAHTWPDEQGKFKMFIHKSSRLARIRYLQPPVKTFLNRNNMALATDWNVLEDYLVAAKSTYNKPFRKDICELVRAISDVEVKASQEQELARLGVVDNGETEL